MKKRVSTATADNWLKARLPTLLASSDFTSGRLTVIVTFDEDAHNTSNNQILTVVLNSGIGHKVSSSYLKLLSITGYYEHVLGAPLLKKATNGFASAFGQT